MRKMEAILAGSLFLGTIFVAISSFVAFWTLVICVVRVALLGLTFTTYGWVALWWLVAEIVIAIIVCFISAWFSYKDK